MSGPPAGAIHVVGWARPADRVTATARALQHLHDDGRPGRVVAARRDAGCDDIGDAANLAELDDRAAVVVHSVDGGADLAPVLPHLAGRAVTLVHHGSAPGSDRGVLRSLRGTTTRSLAADPGAREELRALGFGTVESLDPAQLDGALDDIDADPTSVATLASHPGPLVLSVGTFGPDRSLELLLDAFAALVTGPRPSATLSLCGPSPRWYLADLRRRVLAAGLLACELRSPATDAEVVARLGRAAVVVALHPVGLDPYLRHAARAGVPIVAPRAAATAGLPSDQLVALRPRVRVAELAAALTAATAPG